MQKILSLYSSDSVELPQIWRLFAALIASLLIHGLYRLFSADSNNPALIAITIGSALSLALLLYLSFNRQGLERLRHLLNGWQALAFLLMTAIGVLLGSRMQNDFLYIHAALLYLPFSFFLMSQLFYNGQMRLSVVLFIALLLIGLVSVVRLFGLSYYPNYQRIDEPWVFSYMLNYIKTGALGDPLVPNHALDLSYTFIPMAEWFRNFEPSLWAGRLYNFLLYFPFIALLGLAALHLYNKRTAFFTLIAAFAAANLYSSVHLRHDLSFIIFIAGSTAVYAYALKKESSLWHGLAGLIIGLSFYVHYHAIGIGPLLFIAFYIPRYLARWRGEKRFPYQYGLAFILGGLLGATLVFLTSILPVWGSFVEARDWRGSRNLIHFLLAYGRFLYTVPRYYIEFFVFLLSFIAVSYKRNENDRTLIWFFFVGIGVLAFISRNAYVHYLQHIAPVFALIIGRGLDKMISGLNLKNTGIYLALGLLLLSPMAGATMPLHVLEQQRPLLLEDPEPVRWIRANVPEGSIVIGPNWYYLFLHEDYQYYSSRSWDATSPTRQALYDNNQNLFWQEIQPDVFILLEEETEFRLNVPPDLTLVFPEQISDVHSFTDPGMGNVNIYLINHPE